MNVLNETMNVLDECIKPESLATSDPRRLGNDLYTAFQSILSVDNYVPSSANDSLLSIQQLRVVYSSVEVFWRCAMRPFTLLHSSYCLPCDQPNNPLPSSMLITREMIEGLPVDSTFVASPMVQQLTYYKCLQTFVTNDLFSGHMLLRNADRILMSLFTLKYVASQPESSLSESNRMSIFREVQEIETQLPFIFDGRFTHIFVNKLRVFAKAPLWMREMASDMMRRMLLSPGGLHATLNAYLEDVAQGSDGGQIQMRVVKLLTSVPKSMSKGEYFLNISKQLLDLLVYGFQQNDQVMTVSCIAYLYLYGLYGLYRLY